MLRLLAQTLLSLIANALGLLTASLLLDNFTISPGGLILGTVIFSLATTILGPLIVKIAVANAQFLIGGIALIITLIGLLITSTLTSGIQLRGLSTWISATVIVWLFSVIANVILPLFLFKTLLQKNSKLPSDKG